MTLSIIGIDCAVKDENMGLALARWDGDRAAVVELYKGQRKPGDIARVVTEWLRQEPLALLALDSPLGWPQPLAHTFKSHVAGQPLTPTADQLFRRETDRFVRQRHGKQTLDVGADRIARTAVAALKLLQQVRQATGEDIPLAWAPAIRQTTAIEVYPGGTLRAAHLWQQGYRKPSEVEVRRQMLDSVGQLLDYDCDVDAALTSVDVFDAIVCVLAGADFLVGRAEGPTDLTLAKQEGWTWLRAPKPVDS